MNKKNLIIAAIVSAIVILFIFWLLYFFSLPRPSEINTNSPVSTSTGVKPGETNGGLKVAPLNDEALKKEEVKRAAINFAERFGSFSNQNDGANLKELLPLATTKMQNDLLSYLAKEQKISLDQYSGITTKALSSELIGYAETASTVVISTQRIVVDSKNTQPIIKYQKITIELVKNNNSWLIDKATWQ